ncbi:type II toxin-antitoxin system VapC family toxin [Pontimonas salivibrio]|uniref:type II toxin-antitoxin system VapC family toxin n=1 Tax=Pontimonas salivibrio TaxID=1159327 RepID=UPI000CF34F33|nr:type II toxin-antitoxin system VapC family toxin [Pontimonas salivibrio]
MTPQPGVLLDTHVLLWSLNGARKVSQRLIGVVNSERPVFFSAVSIVEIAIKSQRGTLPDMGDLVPHLQLAGFVELTLDSASAQEMSRFGGLARHDPFDRMLVGQAAAHKLNFETADHTLLSLGMPFIYDATQ